MGSLAPAKSISIVVLLAAALRCTAAGEQPAPSATRADTAVVEEAFLTPFDTTDNIDSPAIYAGDSAVLVFASAKTGDAVIAYDASTGALVRRVGSTGAGEGQLRRPNGLAVVDSVLFVVERDNHRVQAFHLPSLRPIGTIGATELKNPYGIAWVRHGTHAWDVWVTDNYETVEEGVPPDRELGQRVRQYLVRFGNGRITSTMVRALGDTVGDGVLRIVESIAADSAHNRLMVAEETETDSHIKVYDLEGRFTGTIVGRGMFPQQAEGIALYPCGATGGWWVATDQGEQVNTFHVFDRVTLEHVGAFTGAKTRLTDGIAVTGLSFGPFPAGALYGSHLDGGLGAISWDRIAQELPIRCDKR